ncbi:MAG: conjugal transfer protein TraR [Patescibacteria group bacterium]|nr:conjugal transfer protein TraR [Patescibacteria group bacterium]
MADDIDIANEKAQADLERGIAEARKPIPEGVPGECDFCGEWFSRLVGGACGACRDKFMLP